MGNIHLSKEEWDAFERKLNTLDQERERKAEAFLHQFDGIVACRQDGDKMAIEIPWLDDDEILALLDLRDERG